MTILQYCLSSSIIHNLHSNSRRKEKPMKDAGSPEALHFFFFSQHDELMIMPKRCSVICNPSVFTFTCLYLLFNYCDFLVNLFQKRDRISGSRTRPLLSVLATTARIRSSASWLATLACTPPSTKSPLSNTCAPNIIGVLLQVITIHFINQYNNSLHKSV